jgi:hypothetical protein
LLLTEYQEIKKMTKALPHSAGDLLDAHKRIQILQKLNPDNPDLQSVLKQYAQTPLGSNL